MKTKIKTIVRIFIIPILIATVLFSVSQDFAWGMGWLSLILYILLILMVSGLFQNKQADLAEERKTAFKKAKWWDKILLPSVVIIIPLSTLIISSLDHRFGWTRSVSISLQLFFYLISLLGISIIFWSMLVNDFFSSAVRIQTDRGQVVVKTGPYKFVRHPGYVGSILFNVSMPLALGSLWGLIPGFIELLFILLRTKLEDDTLQNELQGYREYAGEVKYKLLPFVW